MREGSKHVRIPLELSSLPCPWFLPVTRLTSDEWIHAPRMPLGDPFSGVCKARADDPFIPKDPELRELCNCGYARGRCDRFPPDSADAIRFSVIQKSETTIRVAWAVECAHAPKEFGTLVSIEGKITAPSCAAAPLLAAQAAAFIRSSAGDRFLSPAFYGPAEQEPSG